MVRDPHPNLPNSSLMSEGRRVNGEDCAMHAAEDRRRYTIAFVFTHAASLLRERRLLAEDDRVGHLELLVVVLHHLAHLEAELAVELHRLVIAHLHVEVHLLALVLLGARGERLLQQPLADAQPPVRREHADRHDVHLERRAVERLHPTAYRAHHDVAEVRQVSVRGGVDGRDVLVELVVIPHGEDGEVELAQLLHVLLGHRAEADEL
eukprot:CAMPEP_0205865404 /NCGR_PEP_ID=MMETSP1083-20121108/7869_1 /ASSEMBLY_ACC=CAM_ASM_000430 /TAXON_ID=97485 /ORGANISM="Prymnesium parvum, Strain Texoma1" /LENGTH=207 /DNA_ID=CAMNT_0053227341 /DNA_START=91 /DNA_END=710 /DNA_ORIENTATION=-